MTNKYLLIILIPVFITLNSCKKTTITPVSCFTQDKSTVVVNESVNFSNCSSNIGTVKWDFGDGSGSTEQSVSHSWTNSGTYTVTLTVYSPDGSINDQSTVTITVGGGNNGSSNPGNYTKFQIMKVEILGFPTKQANGDQWDGNDHPDMYISLVNAGAAFTYPYDNIYTNYDLRFYNTITLSSLKWDYASNPVTVNFPATGSFQSDIHLMDDDGGGAWHYGSIMSTVTNVDFYNASNYGQSPLTFTQGSFSVRFTLTWQ